MPLMKLPILVVLALTALSPPLLASDSPNREEAISQLQRAVAKTNIFDLPSFSMKANAEIDLRGKPVIGTYRLLWNGPDQWREEITFPGYHEIQIGGKGQIWVQRSSDFIPASIHHLHEALGFGSSANALSFDSLVRLNFLPTDVVRKVRNRKDHGENLTCVELEDAFKAASEFCVSAKTGGLFRSPRSLADSDFQPIGDKVFPRSLTLMSEHKISAQVNITEFSTGTKLPAENFKAPSGLSPKPGCINPMPARINKKKIPVYPVAARNQRIQGTVSADATIGTDGVLHLREVVKTPSADLEASTVEALREWRYDPAKCDGNPVEEETILQVNYELRN